VVSPARCPACLLSVCAVPDLSLGVPLGVGVRSGTAQTDPRRGSAQAGGTTDRACGHTLAARTVTEVCGCCMGRNRSPKVQGRRSRQSTDWPCRAASAVPVE
jgi:hypothetical protein